MMFVIFQRALFPLSSCDSKLDYLSATQIFAALTEIDLKRSKRREKKLEAPLHFQGLGNSKQMTFCCDFCTRNH